MAFGNSRLPGMVMTCSSASGCYNTGNPNDFAVCPKTVDHKASISTVSFELSWVGSGSGPAQGSCENRSASVNASKTWTLNRIPFGTTEGPGDFIASGCNTCCDSPDDISIGKNFSMFEVEEIFNCSWCNDPMEPKPDVWLSGSFYVIYNYCLKKIIVGLTGTRNMSGISGICNTLANCSGGVSGSSQFDSVADMLGSTVTITNGPNTCSESGGGGGSATATFTGRLTIS